MNPCKSRLSPLTFLTGMYLILPIAMILQCELAATKAFASKKVSLYAVIVGITEYQDKEIPKLKLSAKDAKDFSTFLSDRKGMFSKSYITVLLNEQATRDNVSQALRQKLRPAGKDDIVIIYLSGHGAADESMPNEFYFLTYDARPGNLFGTGLLMNDRNLFKGIDSERVVLVTDACNSGGFASGLGKGTAKAAQQFLAVFEGLQGRVALASSRPDELSWEAPMFGNSVFTHFFLKGLRGDADKAKTGEISVKDLYEYVYENTRTATKGKQHPQIYSVHGRNDETRIFSAPKYADSLSIKVQFEYVDDEGKVRVLHDGSMLKDGQKLGISFRPESDCFVHILWWDSSGKMGRLFPNPRLTAGDGRVRGSQTYWLPIKEGESPKQRWYCLDRNPGDETIYFIASREPNRKLETLYAALQQSIQGGIGESKGAEIMSEIEREVNIMGIEDYTVTDKTVKIEAHVDRQALFEEMENKIKIAGADAVFRVKFKHVNR
jgi:uncharacterized caspase-like protein